MCILAGFQYITLCRPIGYNIPVLIQVNRQPLEKVRMYSEVSRSCTNTPRAEKIFVLQYITLSLSSCGSRSEVCHRRLFGCMVISIIGTMRGLRIIKLNQWHGKERKRFMPVLYTRYMSGYENWFISYANKSIFLLAIDCCCNLNMVAPKAVQIYYNP